MTTSSLNPLHAVGHIRPDAVTDYETCRENDFDFVSFLAKKTNWCLELPVPGGVRSYQGLLESTKKSGGSHAFFRDN